MKRILMILQSDFPPDIRLEKEIESLSIAGYKIHVVCNQYEKGLNAKFEYCSIDRVNAVFNSILLNKLINFPLFFNPRFFIKIYTNVLKFKPNFLHAHDLPMAPLGIFFGKLFKIPFISDMHENYPAALRAYKKRGLINFLFKNYHLAAMLEKYSLRKADRIITVIEENRSRISEQYNIDSSKISVVSNTVDFESFGKSEVDDEITLRYENKFVILYAGWVSPERGLETPIRAMIHLRELLPDALLLILGNGISVEYLKKYSEEINVQDNVEFQPWCGHEKVNSYMKAASIGILAHPVEEFINTTITHKFFEYMSQKLPVLVPNSDPFVRIINETKAGLYFQSEDAKDFAKKALEIANTKIPYGDNGFSAVMSKYNWQSDSNVLIELYKNLNLQVSL